MMKIQRFENNHHYSNCINYAEINRTAGNCGIAILKRWLPGGRVEGRDYVAINPTRDDRNLGSFRVDYQKGKWIDHATGDKGGDFISLGAYLHGLPQHEAAVRIASMLGVNQ